MLDSDGGSTPRTRGTAFAVLLEQFRDARRERDDDDPALEVIDERLLKGIFQAGWKHQFDDNRSEFRAEVREIVEDAVKAADLD